MPKFDKDEECFFCGFPFTKGAELPTYSARLGRFFHPECAYAAAAAEMEDYGEMLDDTRIAMNAQYRRDLP